MGHKKLKGKLTKLFNKIKEMNASDFAKQEEEKNIILSDDVGLIMAFLERVGQQIDSINEPLMNEYKSKIIEYLTTNNLDFHQVVQLKRKDFNNAVATYCGNKQLNGKLSK